jgi:hypothetical protein
MNVNACLFLAAHEAFLLIILQLASNKTNTLSHVHTQPTHITTANDIDQVDNMLPRYVYFSLWSMVRVLTAVVVIGSILYVLQRYVTPFCVASYTECNAM